MEIFALPFVTFTPSCFARATISIRFLEETACAILWFVLVPVSCSVKMRGLYVLLRGVGLVVHQEKVEVACVLHKESLVAGRHHVAGFLVAAVADLYFAMASVLH